MNNGLTLSAGADLLTLSFLRALQQQPNGTSCSSWLESHSVLTFSLLVVDYVVQMDMSDSAARPMSAKRSAPRTSWDSRPPSV